MTRSMALQNGFLYTELGNEPRHPPAPRDKSETQYR